MSKNLIIGLLVIGIIALYIYYSGQVKTLNSQLGNTTSADVLAQNLGLITG